MFAHEVLYKRLSQEEDFRNNVPRALVRKDHVGEHFRNILYRTFNDEDVRKNADEFVLRIPIRYGDEDISLIDCLFIQLFWWARVRFINSQPECAVEDPLLISEDQRYVCLLYRVIFRQRRILTEKTGIPMEESTFWKHKDYDLPDSVVNRTLPFIEHFPRLVTDFILQGPAMNIPERFFPRIETALRERGSEPLFRTYLLNIVFGPTGYMTVSSFTPTEFGARVATGDFEKLYPEVCRLILENTTQPRVRDGKHIAEYGRQLLCNTRADYETAIEMAETVFQNPLVGHSLSHEPSMFSDDLRPWLFLVYETIRIRKYRVLRERMSERAAELVMENAYGQFFWNDNKYRQAAMMGVVDREYGGKYNGKNYRRALRKYYAAGYFLKEHYFDLGLICSLKNLIEKESQ